MKFMPRAAILAVVTLCAGALANAATPETGPVKDAPVQQNNAPEHHLVPMMPVETAALPQEAAPAAATDTRRENRAPMQDPLRGTTSAVPSRCTVEGPRVPSSRNRAASDWRPTGSFHTGALMASPDYCVLGTEGKT